MVKKKYTEEMKKKAFIGSSGLTDAALRLAKIYSDETGEYLEKPISRQHMYNLKKSLPFKTRYKIVVDKVN